MIQKGSRAGVRRVRRGISLIELLVLLTGVAVMLGLSAVTIQLLLRLHVDSQTRVNSSTVLERLARQLRDDAHTSQTAQVGGENAKATHARASITFRPKADHAIRYIVGQQAITRDETRLDKRLRHESYALQRGQTAHFELFDESGHRMVALRLTHEPGKSQTEPPRTLEVVASLGKHLARPMPSTEGSKP
jgi:hypothetical protein